MRATALPRRREIEAAIAAYNRTDRRMLPLQPDDARLLGVMFPWDTVCRRSLRSLAATGFDRTTLSRSLRALTKVGFLSKKPGRQGNISTYRLHLPPLVRR